MILLDTCAILWLTSAPASLSDLARDTLGSPGTMVSVSAISAFEIGQKSARKRIELPQPVDVWFEQMLQHHGLRELPVTAVIAARATLLPPVHKDPFDRLLIATALEHDLVLMTPDETIRSYPLLKTLW